MKRDSFGKRLGAVLLGLVLAVVLAEGVLQVAALVVERRARRASGEAAPAATGPVVLCVGDSYTYGSGSSSPETAYPGALQTWLRAHDPAERAWQVRNAGWPGRNSTEVVRRLPGFLAEMRPDWVCVLIGLNNRWSGREADQPLPEIGEEPGVAGGESDEGGWKWRLPRLIALAAAAFRERWGADAGLRDAVPDSSALPGAAAPPGTIETSDPLAALETIRSLRKDAADVRPLLDALERVRPRIREMDDPDAAAALVLLLGDMSRYPDAVEEGRVAMEKYGRTPALANALVRPLARLQRTDEAIELGRLAVADAPDDPDRHRRLALALRLGRHDEEAFAEMTRAFVLTGDRGDYETDLRRLPPFLLRSAEWRAEALANVEIPGSRREEVEAALELVRNEDRAAVTGDVLDRDLGRIRELVEASGARLILLSYPLGLGGASRTLRAFARENDIPFVDVEPVFRDLVAAEGRDRYFIPDGHCNDAGYAVVAGHVGRTLLDGDAAEHGGTP